MKTTPAYLLITEESYKTMFIPEISEKCEVFGVECLGAEVSTMMVEAFEYLNKGLWLTGDDHAFNSLQILVQHHIELLSCTAIPVYLSEITVGGHQSRWISDNFRELPS